MRRRRAKRRRILRLTLLPRYHRSSFKKRNLFDTNWTVTKLLPFVVLLSLFLGGCMGINQLQPAPIGSHVEDPPSPSGKHLNKEKDPSVTSG